MQNFKFIFSFFTLLFFLFAFSLHCFADETAYVWSSTNVATQVSTNTTNSNNLSLESPSAILIEQTTGQVLYEHNSHEQLRPASVTKVMSILLIMEAIDNR